MINGQSRTHRGRRRLPYTRATAPDTQQRALLGWRILLLLQPPEISSSKKGTVGQDTNKYRNLFFYFVVPPTRRRRRKKEKPRIFRGFLNDFFSLNWFIPMKNSRQIFGAERDETYRIFQPSSSSIISVCVCVHSEWTIHTIPLGLRGY